MKKHLEIFCIDFIKRSRKYALFLPTNRKKRLMAKYLRKQFQKSPNGNPGEPSVSEQKSKCKETL
jgi:hypothetical protein